MKKHIFGLALFSLIVSAAVIFYAIFNASEIVPVYETEIVSAPQYSSTKSCWKMKKESKKFNTGLPTIKQATLSAESGLFVFEIGCPENLQQISLYFYQKNESKTQLMAIEEIDLKPSVNCENTSSLYKDFGWAKEINRGSNIYVIARNSNQGAKLAANFDESLAVPVLMAEGRLNF